MKDPVVAHKYSSRHRAKLVNDRLCGCFYCLRIFTPVEITEWIDDGGDDTAVCPYCGIDGMIGESSGYPVTTEFLSKMKKHWFSGG